MRGMTLIEILIVVSLISVTSLALYHALANGLRVWDYSDKLVVEEDIALFVEKLSSDLRNTLYFSKIPFEGDRQSYSFPTIIKLREPKDNFSKRALVSEQIGRVFYSYDVSKKAILRRQASYGQALNNEYDAPQTLVGRVESLAFEYIYLTEKEEVISESVLQTVPSALVVEVTFFDQKQKKTFKRTIDVPLGS